MPFIDPEIIAKIADALRRAKLPNRSVQTTGAIAGQTSETTPEKDNAKPSASPPAEGYRFLNNVTLTAIYGDPSGAASIGLRKGNLFSLFPMIPQTPPLRVGEFLDVTATSNPIPIAGGKGGNLIASAGATEVYGKATVGPFSDTTGLAMVTYNGPGGVQVGLLHLDDNGLSYLTQIGVKEDLSAITPLPPGTVLSFSLGDTKYLTPEIGGKLGFKLPQDTEVTGGMLYIGKDHVPTVVLGTNVHLAQTDKENLEAYWSGKLGLTVKFEHEQKLGKGKLDLWGLHEERGYDSLRPPGTSKWSGGGTLAYPVVDVPLTEVVVGTGNVRGPAGEKGPYVRAGVRVTLKGWP